MPSLRTPIHWLSVPIARTKHTNTRSATNLRHGLMLDPLWVGFCTCKEIVMSFSRPLLGLCISALVVGCGGGDDEPSGARGDPRAPIVVSPIGLSSGESVAVAGVPVYFSGGECSGGYGKLFTMWSYGDGSPNGSSSTHTYANPSPKMTVRVTCTDSSYNDKKYGITAFDFVVAP